MDIRSETTELVVRTRHGDQGARDALFARLYEPLRGLARGQLAPSSTRTLDTTELVHEVYLRLVEADRLSVTDRAHFFAVSARVMRQVLVDRFRRRDSAKRGGGLPKVSLDEGRLPVGGRGEVLLALDEALGRLSELDQRAGRIVELKFFGGMTEAEIAAVLGVSVRTVSGDWRKAKAWLARELEAA